MSDPKNYERFIGSELYTLDDKGRITVPRRWRTEDEKEQFRVLPDSRGKCARLMEPWRFSEFRQQIEDRFGTDLARIRDFKRTFNSSAAEVELDKQGRIAIPKSMCESLDLRGDVWLVGTGDLIEIWNKEKYEAHLETQLPAYQDMGAVVGI